MYSRWRPFLLILLISSVGCFQPEIPSVEQLARGYVLLLPGVESYGFHHLALVRGLREGGLDRAAQINEWGYKPFGTFPNLMSLELNRQRAARLAGALADYRKQYPKAPISIVGYSGGGAIALFIAEALPGEVVLDRIILLGAAISPQYDLGPALARTRCGIVNFYSESDWFMAGWATETFGTMDRKKTSTAGRTGFRDVQGALLEHDQLVQVAWRREWRSLGHSGDHSGWRSQEWARAVLAPYLLKPCTQPAGN